MNTIGPLVATSCTLHVPESGAWVLDVDHDLPTGVTAPSGKVTCMIGGVAFLGTVDPTASGTFGTRARRRVVGAIEWGKTLPKRDFQNPVGIPSSVVISATAAELGIPVVVLAPETLPPNYARVAGTASQVLGRSGWWVSPDGATTVGPRPPLTPAPDFFLREYDPLTRVAQASSSAPILPGTVLVDPRLPGGTMRVREVTQTWGPDGATASLWLGELGGAAQGPRLGHAVQSLALAAVRPELLTHHRYTVVGQTPDGGYLLQSEVAGPVPDATPVLHWPGVPGFRCEIAPGSSVLVGFRGREPVVIGFDATPPIACTWDYARLNLGGESAKPTANADVIEAILDLLVQVNLMHTGPTTAPYPGIATAVASIKAKLAAMKTRSA